MADKSFGVKELNLLNASGTPTITSPNNLNLNANTVAISTSVTIGHNITVSANAGISSLNVSGIATVVNFNATGISTIAQPADSNPMANWTITNNSASAYRFTGPGQSGSDDNPDLYLVRGHRYIFKHNATGSHPIQIRVASGGAAYTDGVTYSNTGNNTTTDGNNLIINLQHDAPARLFYQCTSHGGMVGNIYVVGGPQVISGVVTATSFVGDGSNLTGLSGVSLANGVDNRVVTASSASALNGESTLTHSAGVLSVNEPSISTDGKIIVKGNDTNNHDIITAYSNTQTRGSFAIRNGIGISPSFLVGTRGGSETLGLMTNGTERLRIDSNGKVSIASGAYGGGGATPELYVRGTSGRQVKIHNTNAATCSLQLTNSASGEGEDHGMQFALLGGGGGYFKHHVNNANVLDMYSQVSGSGKYIMKIYNDGKIGQQSNSDCLMLSTSQDGSGNNYFLRGSKNSTQPGGGNDVVWIYEDGDIYNNNQTYGQQSDIKLKENIVDASSQWNDIKNLKVRNFNFKASTGYDTHTQIGLVAQEAELVSPGLIKVVKDRVKTEEKNELDSVSYNESFSETETTKYVKYSVLYMKAIKCLQEAQARIETLEAKVAALEGS